MCLSCCILSAAPFHSITNLALYSLFLFVFQLCALTFTLFVCAALNVLISIHLLVLSISPSLPPPPPPHHHHRPSSLFPRSACHYAYPPECGITPLHASRKTTSCSSWSVPKHCQSWQWLQRALPLTLFSSRKLERRVKRLTSALSATSHSMLALIHEVLFFLLEDSGS